MSPLPESLNGDTKHNLNSIPVAAHDSFEVILPPFLAGVSKYIRPQRMIRKLQAENEKLHYENTHDELTNCLNTRGLKEYLASCEPPVAAIYIDITYLKVLNDADGHARGDEVIKSTADIILHSLRDEDVAARVGGDEFIVMLGAPRVDRQVESKSTEEVLGIVMDRVVVQSQSLVADNPDLLKHGVDIAVGGAVWENNMTVVNLIQLAEANMYEHKASQHIAVNNHRQ